MQTLQLQLKSQAGHQSVHTTQLVHACNSPSRLTGVALFAMGLLVGGGSFLSSPVWAQGAAGSTLPLNSYQYITPPVATSIDGGGQQQIARTPGQLRLVKLYDAQDYATLADEGRKLTATEKLDDSVMMMLANSLAWTSQSEDAIKAYQSISDPSMVADANVGIANVLRWQNREHLSAPIYQSVLQANPRHTEARNGLLAAQRELAPRTTITLGQIDDSNQFHRTGLTINHRWRTNDGYGKFEIELHGVRDTMPDVNDLNSTLGVNQQNTTLRYQALDRMYKPTFEIGAPTGRGTNAPHGGMKLLFNDDHVQLDVGYVNWGLLSNNANGLDQGLNATHVGLKAQGMSGWGEVTGEMHYYGVTDSNTVWYGGTRLTSKWTLFGSRVRPYIGLDLRQANFFTPSYWSPERGYGTLYTGLRGDWDAEDWSLFAQGQVGTGVYGEAGNSWMASVGARRWLTRDFALGFNALALSSLRDGDPYRLRMANLILEKVWR